MLRKGLIMVGLKEKNTYKIDEIEISQDMIFSNSPKYSRANISPPLFGLYFALNN